MIREVSESRGQVSIGETERGIENHLRRYHESIDGAYQMWGLFTRADSDREFSTQLREWIKKLREGG